MASKERLRAHLGKVYGHSSDTLLSALLGAVGSALDRGHTDGEYAVLAVDHGRVAGRWLNLWGDHFQVSRRDASETDDAYASRMVAETVRQRPQLHALELIVHDALGINVTLKDLYPYVLRADQWSTPEGYPLQVSDGQLVENFDGIAPDLGARCDIALPYMPGVFGMWLTLEVESPFAYTLEQIRDAYPLVLIADQTGREAEDSSGNGRHGTYLGQPLLGVEGAVADDHDTAVQLNGPAGDYIDCGNPVGLRLGAEMTIECVLNPSIFTEGGGNVRIVNKRDDANNAWGLQFLPAGSTARISLTVEKAGVLYEARSVAATINFLQDWHVMATFAAGVITIDIEGIDVTSPTNSPQSLTGLPNFTIGRHNHATTRYSGVIDEVSYYHVALPPARRAAHAAARLAGNYREAVMADGPAGYWRLGESYAHVSDGHLTSPDLSGGPLDTARKSFGAPSPELPTTTAEILEVIDRHRAAGTKGVLMKLTLV